MSKPNIVLIVADQFRGDCLGILGHPDVKTPYLDTLAARGAYFPNMYTACPSCIPARAALLTGLSQEKNGRVGYQDGLDWNYEHTLAGELSKEGYYTQCIGKMHVHPPRKLMGFHNIEIHDGYLHYYRRDETPAYEHQTFYDDYLYWLKDQKGISRDIDDAGLQCNSWLARLWPYEEKYHPTNWVTERALDFLRRRDHEKPFFLNVSYVRPHPPLDAPKCYFDMYRSMNLRKPVRGDWNDENALNERGWEFDSLTGTLDETQTNEALIGYYACITHLDHQIGRLLEALPKNTVVMFTSDHGEMLMDHMFFRKSLPYRGSASVPMILFGTKLRGMQDRVCELRDVLPTLVDIAGGGECDFSDGESLLSDGEGREYLHGEHSYGDLSNHYIVTKTDKYVWFSKTGREQYFDLEKDINETHNAINDECAFKRVNKLRSFLIESLKDRPEGFVENGQLVAGKESYATIPNA